MRRIFVAAALLSSLLRPQCLCANAQGARRVAKKSPQGSKRSQRKPRTFEKPTPREVAPHCAVCESVAVSIHGILSRRMGLTSRAWENRLREACGDGLGCDIFLSRKNLAALSKALQELSSAEGGQLPQVHVLQAMFCFDITGACPSGHRGERRHEFQAVDRPSSDLISVKVRFWSQLPTGKVHVYWMNPERSRDMTLSGTVVPGGSLVQHSFSSHTFRLLGPGVQWTDKIARLDVVLSDRLEQHYEISLNESWVPDLPTFIADSTAAPNLEDSGDSSEVSLVANPDAIYNRRYVVQEVFPKGFRSDL